VRPGVNYGSTRIPYGMCPVLGKHWTFIERIKAGKPIITWNQGHNKLNLTRVEDYAAGMVALIGNPKAYNEAFNVVGDNVYTWKDVLSVMGEILGCDVKTIDIPVVFYANELDGDERESLLGGRACNLVCSNEKMKRLNPEFKSKYSLEEGIRMTLKFYQDNNYYHGIDYVWDGECDRIINKYANSKKYKFTLYEGTSSIREAKVDYYSGYYKTILYKKVIKRLLLKLHL
jgi:nucleoside-diphosphate-sugar epimerase